MNDFPGSHILLYLALASLAIILLLVAVIWSHRRHRDPKLRIECQASIGELIPSLAGLTLGTPVAGNAVKVHENGAFFDVLIERIGAARKSVNFETFLWSEGVLEKRVADALSERARAGVQVRHAPGPQDRRPQGGRRGGRGSRQGHGSSSGGRRCGPGHTSRESAYRGGRSNRPSVRIMRQLPFP